MSEHKSAAIVYCRVSTINQAAEGTSLESQESAGIAHAQALGFSVGRVTKEVYSAAELWDRPKLSQDRADLKTGQFAALVCYSTDRLSRDPIHLAILAEESERGGVALHFVSETFDYDDDEAALIRYVKGYSSKKEREKIRERTLRGRYTRAVMGKVHNSGSELYGYRRDKERGVRVIYEPEAQIVVLIFEWVAQDRLPLRTVARRLNEQGVRPPSVGKVIYRDPDRLPARWSKTQVRHLLNNPAYKGEAIAWRWRRQSRSTASTLRPEREWVRLPDGVVSAIVSPALWQEAHDALALHGGETTRNETRPYLLRGHIFCSVCNKPLYPIREHTNTPHPKRVYRCGSRDSAKGACGGQRVPAEDVEAWAWGKITFTLKRPDVLAAEIARREAEGPDATLADDLEKAKRAIARCERDQKKLVAKLRGVEDDEEGSGASRLWKLVEEEINALEVERAGWLKTMADIEGRLADQRLAHEQLVALYDYCARVGANLDPATFEDQRLALVALAARVTGNAKDWRIDGRIPLDIRDPVLSSETITSGRDCRPRRWRPHRSGQ